MKRIIVFLNILVICLCSNCGTNEGSYNNVSDNTLADNVETLDVNSVLRDALNGNGEFELDDIVDTVSIVALETRESSLISKIRCLTFSNDFIYVLDYEGSVHIFNRLGGYVRSLQKGNGPGEIFGPQHISFNETFNALFVLEYSRVSKFSPDGIFIDVLDNVPIHHCNIAFGNNFLVLQDSTSNESHMRISSVIKVDSCFKIVGRTALPPINRYVCSSIIPMSLCPDGGVLINRPIDNNVYWFFNDTLRIKYRIECPDYFNTVNDYKDLQSMKINYDNDCFFSGNFVENSNYQLFSAEHQSYYYFYVNKQTSKIRCGNIYKSSDVNTGAGVPVYLSTLFGLDDDYFVGILLADSDFINEQYGSILKSNACISQEDVDKIKSHSPDDNPLLVFYKLK